MKLQLAVYGTLLFVAPAALAQTVPLSGSLARMDSNGDGKLTKAEWQADGDTRFKKIDRNGDSFVTRDEFAGRYAKETAEQIAGRAEKYFKVDANGDGKVSKAEQQVAEDADFAHRDKNGDGIITGEG